MFKLADAYSFLQMNAPAEAERICLGVLKRERRNVDALLLLAQIYGGANRLRDCIEVLARAHQARSSDADIAYNLGVALTMSGQHGEAVAIYRTVLRLDPAHINARMNLAACLLADGQALAAADEMRPLRARAPQSLEILLNFASALIEAGHWDEALAALLAAKDSVGPHAQLDVLIGRALNGLRRHGEALAFFEAARAQDPASAFAANGLGVTLLWLGRAQEAVAPLEAAIALDPNAMQAHHNFGKMLHQLGRFEEAIASFDQAMALDPTIAEPVFEKSFTLLLRGDFARGWPLYEARKSLRLQALGQNASPIKSLTALADAKGKKVLVDWEQGLGDTIQFARYAKALADFGALVTLRVQPPLCALLSTLDPRMAVTAEQPRARDFAFHVQAMSLPFLFGTREETIPFAGGYLAPEPARVAQWRAQIGEAGFKVAIAWQGNRQAKIDLGRSFELSHFQALLGARPDLRLISLQKGEGSEQLEALPAGLKVETLGANFDAGPQAFLDSAAVMACADLVITSDTALAHLAGALGKPVWVALRHVPDWRWMMHRPDSPWYQSMRLFRQTKPGDWDGLFAQMGAALEAMRLGLVSIDAC